MAIVGASNLSPQQIFQQIIGALKAHRLALQACNDLYTWASGITAADLEAAPLNISAGDATAILNALADVHNEYVNYALGLPAVLPATGYKYGATQFALTGPF